MQTQALDPWNDAQALATRLARPQAELLVALGAESWCQKCAALRPAFEALYAHQSDADLSWLWLDLEDHAEFLGDFVPEDLPLLLRWRQGRLQQVAVLEAIDPAPAPGAVPERLRALPVSAELPDLWAAFSERNWAA
ncbi:thioredoxin [Mitsuaria sp. WAJ17]|uniref:thioredoxin n=1 Tax=Mitsuaria sp. WAJ17 TaxID=2761452 RepID=UPI00160119D1|nr:thioredoxin [Mitsuaria sp. WAJ17]MBB2487622.1 thioredoxin [Mitsuaria sp. WAJ17]